MYVKDPECHLAFYTLTPFVEEAARLLLGSAQLWHPWSGKRRKELTQTAYALLDTASRFRERAIGWAPGLSSLALAHDVPGGFAFHWYFGAKAEAFPDAVPHLAGCALALLLRVWPVYQKIADASWMPSGQNEGIPNIIEDLSEAPYTKAFENAPYTPSDELVRLLAVKGALHECEGLCYSLGRCEDQLADKTASPTNPRKRKAATLSREAMEKLADEIGVSFEALEDTLTLEYSSWYSAADAFHERAETVQQEALRLLAGSDPLFAKHVTPAWIPGSPMHHGALYGVTRSSTEAAEQITRFFIARFRILIEGEGGREWLPTPERVRIAHQ